MPATQLLLHHRYQHNIAFDWSGHANHGLLEHVATDDPNGLAFQADPGALVAVQNSPSLRDFGELRVRVIFRPLLLATVSRRLNLVEGHLSFALVVNPNQSLQGTINSPSDGWVGPLSQPGVVSMGTWHTADFSHDGISRSRLHLDGVLVAEHNAAAGPIPDLGPKGVIIGHWPEDDRYTFAGDLADVQIWKDDPARDAAQALDDCCLDRSWVDERVQEARRDGWTGDAARASFAKLFGDARAAAAEVRGGDPARIGQIQGLTQQALLSISSGDTAGLEGTLGSLQNLVTGQLGSTRVDQLGHELLDALRATPVGGWMGDTPEGSLAFFEQLVTRTCLGHLVPDRPKDREPKQEHPPEKLPPRDPATADGSDVPVPPDPPLADEHVDVPPDVDKKNPEKGDQR